MIGKRLVIIETAGVARNGEWVRLGVPFAKGELDEIAALALADSSGIAQPLQSSVLNRWSDGSVKWALVDFSAKADADGQTEYFLKTGERGTTPRSNTGISIEQGSDQWLVNSGAAWFSIDARMYRPFVQVTIDGHDLLSGASKVQFVGADGVSSNAVVDTISVEELGPLHAVLHLEGRFVAEEARYSSRLHFYANSSRVMIEFTLHNPRAALHPGGLWDLGDPGSILFRELAFNLLFVPGMAQDFICIPEPGIDPLEFDGNALMTIYQESSGGDAWQSPNHRSRDGKVPFSSRGYELRYGDTVIRNGKRAAPVTRCGSGGKVVAAALSRFWQEFPSAMTAGAAGLKISLFPACCLELHELQGGEQKSRTICLDFEASTSDMAWALSPLKIQAAPEVYRHARVIEDLPWNSNGQDDLVDSFISGPDEFFRKREVLDEYGWRNFGDVYADHEAVGHDGEKQFVSHYNNQYDLCAGLCKKGMATGDSRWWELAEDLARHVLDIDIYHTDQDREEYNQGPFWHTDHYIDAGLSTHRSFSREHLKSRDPRFCGGGPGAEHCYTSGLMYHYFQTGNPAFREAVTNTALWSLRSLSGPETILAVLKKSCRYFRQLRSKPEGSKSLFPRYPFTRGTGNAITACLDAYEVCGDSTFLTAAENLIRGAIHPDDDIEARNISDVENTWFYTVLMAAIGKFLNKKCELGQLDGGYAHGRASYLAYAEWMLQHEYLYLDKPEILQYPNETWAAQDLRKSVIFYYAARYAPPDRREAFIERGRYFFAGAAEELKRHASSSLTRPVALVLQNGWVGNRFYQEIPATHHDDIPLPVAPPTPSLSIGAVAARIADELFDAARVTTLKREMAWLKARLG